MEEETKRILEENLEISRQSLKILKGIRRANRLNMAFKILYWLVILGAAAGAYYFLEPYVKSAIGTVYEVQQVLPRSQNGGQDTSSDFLKQLQNLLK
jgi:hypothetical protein